MVGFALGGDRAVWLTNGGIGGIGLKQRQGVPGGAREAFMGESKNRVLVLLLSLNLLLLTGVVVSLSPEPAAYGQIRPYDYLMIPGSVSEALECVWVVDMANMQLTTCIYDQSRQQVQIGQVVSLLPAMRQGQMYGY